jgi:signal transduction histidine kinase/DNA-binding response OmpR family regulator
LIGLQRPGHGVQWRYMSLRFGIRGKIALLVVVAAALAAYLVARMLARSSEELLRGHELVDLGDEAQLRGWEIADQVAGLRDDALALGYSTEFQTALMSGAREGELRSLAERVCRRYWGRYLRIEMLPHRGAEGLARVVEEKAVLAEPGAAWLPAPGGPGADKGQRTLSLSEIRRVGIERPGIGEARWEPVIWACVALPGTDVAGAEAGPVLRILMSLDSAASPRHLFALLNSKGEVLVRPEEYPGADGPINDALFQGIAKSPEVSAAMDAERSVSVTGQPQVQGIKLYEYQPLLAKYWFLEGLPGEALRHAMAAENEEELSLFFDGLRAGTAQEGRLGGVGGASRELRLLAPDRARLDRLRVSLEQGLAREYGADLAKISWRKPVVCDEAHAWTIRVDAGTAAESASYLIIYAVLDDELASSIEQEMAELRQYAFGVAVLAGVIAFMISLFFVRPLQRMTQTAQRVAEAEPERLPAQLRRLVDHLPVGRSDEVGDIARASKRLFEEVLESQEKLEARVRERTAKLAQANLDLEEANRQLHGLSREKDAFVAKVSHDLRQPLNAIFLQVEALKLSKLDERQTKDVQRIHDHAARELNLVNDILEYQKIIMGAETLSRDEIDLARLLEEVVEAHSPAAAAKGLAFQTVSDPGIGFLEADRRRVRQILDNLTGNACKFTTAGSVTVEFHGRTLGGQDWVEFTIADTGRGMTAEEQAKAFVPFVSNKKGNEGGTGLGLSICRELCQQMGGSIGFVSEPGRGTRFTVMLPRRATGGRYGTTESVGQAEREPAPLSEPQLLSRALILVIDDDDAVRDLMRRTLEAEGCDVICASGAAEGLDLARSRRPSAITLDIVMPDGDGWEVLSALKADPVTEGIPVIMVSVMADRSDAVALGVEDCLVKPVDLDRLSRVVRRIASRGSGRRLLVVDDDAASRGALCRLLTGQGWETREASGGNEALDWIEREIPAAIVLDLLMPEMDGYDFLLELAREPRWREIPVLVLTGARPTADEADFLKRRVEKVIEKSDTSARQIIDRLRARLRTSEN